MFQKWYIFFAKKHRKMLKKIASYDINILRKNAEKLSQNLEEKNVKK